MPSTPPRAHARVLKFCTFFRFILHRYPPSKTSTPLYGRRPPRQTSPNTAVIIYKAKGDDLISHPLFKYDVESILLLVNALVVSTLWTCLATLERTLSTWLCTLSCLSHIL